MHDSIENFQPKASEPRFAMNREAAEEYINNLERFPVRKRICICGHTVSSHSFASRFGYTCKPGQIWCVCKMPDPVYLASDARHFMRSTAGAGYRHALGLGIASLIKKGGDGEWMVPLSCSIAGCLGLEISVACVDEDSRVTNRSTERSLLLCRDHILDLGGNLL